MAERGQSPQAKQDDDDPYHDAPEIGALEQVILQLHRRASTCRPVSMGGIPGLPWTAIRDVMRDADISDGVWPMIEALIEHVDRWIMDWHEHKPKDKPKAKSEGRHGRARQRAR